MSRCVRGLWRGNRVDVEVLSKVVFVAILYIEHFRNVRSDGIDNRFQGLRGRSG